MLTSKFECRIGKQERLKASKTKLEDKIGPGTYKVKSCFETAVAGAVPFTKADYYRGRNSVQPREKQKHLMPGPGTYAVGWTDEFEATPNLRTKRTTGKFTEKLATVKAILGGRAKRDTMGVSTEKTDQPGPGSYESGKVDAMFERMMHKGLKINGTLHNKSSCFLSTSNSEENLQKLKEKKSSVQPLVPAPGQYDVERSIEYVTKNPHKPSIGNANRFNGVGIGKASAITPAPTFDPSNLDLDSTHREFPKNSFPRQPRFS